MPNSTATLFCQSVLCTLYTIELVVSAHFLDSLVIHHKVFDKVNKTLFIKHLVNLLQKQIIQFFAISHNTCILLVALILIFMESIWFPFHIIFLFGLNSSIAQTFYFITGHTKLHRRKEWSDKSIFLICQILTNTIRNRHTTFLQFNDRHRNTIHINYKVWSFFLTTNYCNFLGNRKVVICGCFHIHKINRLWCSVGSFPYLGTILQKIIDFMICIIQTMCHIICCFY